MSRTPQEQLVSFLSDMYSVEQQALAQMVSAPQMAQEPELAAKFRKHYLETQEQAELVRQRLEAQGGSPSIIKDTVMKLGGKGFLLFARTMPETPGRLVVHAYSYEAMEWAGYEMLLRFAEHAGDAETAAVAKAIGAQERSMMHRLEEGFDAAEHVSHEGVAPQDFADHIRRHLTEVHAFESQNAQLLERSEDLDGDSELQRIYQRQQDDTDRHALWLEERLESLEGDPSAFKDTALKIGGLNWSLFFQAQTDTPAKLAAFDYAVLHLEIGGYELLKRTARRAGDDQTGQLCELILADKRAIAERLASAFELAVEATLVVVA